MRRPHGGRAYRAALTVVSIAAFAVLFSVRFSPAEIVDRIVAVVNDNIITLSELNAAAAVATKGFAEELKGEKIVETKSGVLDALIEKKLMKQAADKGGIEVSEKEIDNAIEDIKTQNNVTHEELLMVLTGNGLTYRVYREQMKEEIRQVKFISKEFRSKISIGPEDIEEYYKRNTEAFSGPSSFSLRLIFLTGRDEATMKRRLKVVYEELESGEDFREVAKRYSDGPGAATGGELGEVGAGELDRTIESAAIQLVPGDVSGPIFTEKGVNIIQLLEKSKGRTRPLEEVGEDVFKTLFQLRMQERYTHWIEDVKKVAYIEVRL